MTVSKHGRAGKLGKEVLLWLVLVLTFAVIATFTLVPLVYSLAP